MLRSLSYLSDQSHMRDSISMNQKKTYLKKQVIKQKIGYSDRILQFLSNQWRGFNSNHRRGGCLKRIKSLKMLATGIFTGKISHNPMRELICKIHRRIFPEKEICSITLATSI